MFKCYNNISDQEERSQSVDQFRSGKKDVLVATDVASKGLDFPNMQHVINYDMPEDIENYGEAFNTFINLPVSCIRHKHLSESISRLS